MGRVEARKCEMSTLYQDLMEGFQEILEAQETGKKMKSITLSIPDVHHYTNVEISSIQNRNDTDNVCED